MANRISYVFGREMVMARMFGNKKKILFIQFFFQMRSDRMVKKIKM